MKCLTKKCVREKWQCLKDLLSLAILVPFLINGAGAAEITFGHSKGICSIEYDTHADPIELSTYDVPRYVNVVF